MTRREYLLTATAISLAQAEGRGVRTEIFLKSPGKGAAVMAYAYYAARRGGGMISIEQRWSRSDTVDRAYYRRSNNYGRTWSKPVEQVTGERRANGMFRRHPRGFWVDPSKGKLLEFWQEGVLPTDDPLEGLRQWRIHYRVAEGPAHPLIHRGNEYNSDHPLPGVWAGKNSAAIGDQSSQPMSYRGRVLLPVEVAPLAPDGSLANPGGGYTWHDSAVLHGRWIGNQLEWEMSDLVKGDPERTTRGTIEPTIAELGDGRLLMVMRGSNDRKPHLPSHRWVSYSRDGGYRWTKPEPWTDEAGNAFFSPSSCSQLLKHSSGRLFWLGNLVRDNPRGNRPRYPFVLAEVDRKSGLLRKSTVRIVDDLKDGENPQLTLSNFYAREDRQTGEVSIHMTRLFALPDGWQGDATLYRVRI